MMVLGERVLEAAAREKAERVVGIHLQVGRLAGVDSFALRTAAEIVLEGTLAEGARLTLEEVPPAWWCRFCLQEFGFVEDLGRCPSCGHISRHPTRGSDLILHSLEVEP